MATKNNLTIIDADSLIWGIGWENKEKTQAEIIAAVDAAITEILTATYATQYIGFFGGKSLDRKRIDPTYKGKRPEKPEWFAQLSPLIMGNMLATWGFVRCPDEHEADDYVISAAITWRALYNVIIAGIDKDLKQIPGTFYNYSKKILEQVDEVSAEHNFWVQVLSGDPSDGIPGLPKVGPVTAKKILTDMPPEFYPAVVFDEYRKRLSIQKFATTVYLLAAKRNLQIDHNWIQQFMDLKTVDLFKR